MTIAVARMTPLLSRFHFDEPREIRTLYVYDGLETRYSDGIEAVVGRWGALRAHLPWRYAVTRPFGWMRARKGVSWVAQYVITVSHALIHKIETATCAVAQIEIVRCAGAELRQVANVLHRLPEQTKCLRE